MDDDYDFGVHSAASNCLEGLRGSDLKDCKIVV